MHAASAESRAAEKDSEPNILFNLLIKTSNKNDLEKIAGKKKKKKQIQQTINNGFKTKQKRYSKEM